MPQLYSRKKTTSKTSNFSDLIRFLFSFICKIKQLSYFVISMPQFSMYSFSIWIIKKPSKHFIYLSQFSLYSYLFPNLDTVLNVLFRCFHSLCVLIYLQNKTTSKTRSFSFLVYFVFKIICKIKQLSKLFLCLKSLFSFLFFFFFF